MHLLLEENLSFRLLHAVCSNTIKIISILHLWVWRRGCGPSFSWSHSAKRGMKWILRCGNWRYTEHILSEAHWFPFFGMKIEQHTSHYRMVKECINLTLQPALEKQVCTDKWKSWDFWKNASQPAAGLVKDCMRDDALGKLCRWDGESVYIPGSVFRHNWKVWL